MLQFYFHTNFKLINIKFIPFNPNRLPVSFASSIVICFLADIFQPYSYFASIVKLLLEY